MDAETKTHQGENIATARRWKKIDQKELAEKLNVSQPKISEWENTKILSDEIIDKVAKALNVNTDFIRSFDTRMALRTYNIDNSSFNAESAENGNDDITQVAGENTNNYTNSKNVYNYNISPDELELFIQKRIILERKNAELEVRNELLRKEIEELKKKM